MKNYIVSFAPMEGITGRIFRKVFDRNFNGVTDYYTPFITPKEKRGVDKKDIKELLPAHNEGIKIVPQILTSSGEAFNLTASKLMEMGYKEVNLNLGCPSGTVVNKGRGSGALKNLDNLYELLSCIFDEAVHTGLKISIKTRIGYEDASEFGAIISLYRQFPLEKLIIHPRTRMEFYKGSVHKESFEYALKEYLKTGEEDKLCFNGELKRVEDVDRIEKEFPMIDHIMIGRGLLRYPFLLEDIEGKEAYDRQERIRNFLEELLSAYLEEFNGGAAAVLKLKEIWFYLQDSFKDCEAYVKDIKKAKGVAEYRAAVNVLLSNCKVL